MKKLLLLWATLCARPLGLLHSASIEQNGNNLVIWATYSEAVKVLRLNEKMSPDTYRALLQIRTPDVFRAMNQLAQDNYVLTGAVLDELDHKTQSGRYGWVFEKRAQEELA